MACARRQSSPLEALAHAGARRWSSRVVATARTGPRRVVVRATEQSNDVTYSNYPWDRLLIRALNSGMSEVQGGVRPMSSMWDYDAFIELCTAIKRNQSAIGQQEAGLAVLQALVPLPLMKFFGWIYSMDPRAASIFSAWGSSIASGFLVGPSTVERSPMTLPSGLSIESPNVVKITKCRFLAESGNCVGMCTNLCKVPAQRFFNEDVGFAMTMEPNFEDGSCKMIWGQAPPPLQEDKAMQEPCKTHLCTVYREIGASCDPKSRAE